MSISPGTRLGVYEVLTLIGAGGMGEVYRARDTRLNRDVQSLDGLVDRARAVARAASATSCGGGS